jgi:hypothetical protein
MSGCGTEPTRRQCRRGDDTCFNNQASGSGRGERDMQGVEHGPQGIPAKTWARGITLGRDVIKDVIAGLVASVDVLSGRCEGRRQTCDATIGEVRDLYFRFESSEMLSRLRR